MLSNAQVKIMESLSKGARVTPDDVHHMTVRALVDRKLVKLAGRHPDKVLSLTSKGQKELKSAA